MTPVVDRDLVRRLAERAGEGPALLGLRENALAVFEATPLPDRVRHLWKFTPPRKLVPQEIGLPGRSVAEAHAIPGEASGAVLAPAGDRFEVRLPEAARTSGVRVRPLAEGDAEAVGAVVPAQTGYFEALNLAAFTAGVVVEVPDGVRIAEPVRIVVPALPGASLPRLLVRAGRGAELTVLEEHLGGGAESRTVSVTEILAGPGAQVTHAVFEHWDAGARGHLTVRSRVERDAKVTLVVASMGGDLAKMNVGAVLEEPGARSEIGGVVLAARRQHMDHHTFHHHRAPNTFSTIDFKVALTGRGRSAYTGLIRIDRRAAGSEAYQENRNLLLSEGSRADTIPELEILTDDVQCSHGATVAPIDQEQLFYLESRGIAPQASRRLIVQGFLETALGRLPEVLRQEMEGSVLSGLDEFLEEGEA